MNNVGISQTVWLYKHFHNLPIGRYVDPKEVSVETSQPKVQQNIKHTEYAVQINHASGSAQSLTVSTCSIYQII